MEFLRHTLSNGLQVVAEVNERAYSAAFAYFVNTGARDETDEEAGVSHFLEHMAFKGTPQRSAEDVNRELDAIGSQSNAYTSEEHTVYYLAVLPEYQERAIALLSDIMRPSLRPDDFATEKQVILEEIKKYEDEPPFGAFERSKALHFGQHPLARSVLGTTESVSALTPEQMGDYFRRRYSPGNIVLAAAGNVNFEALVRDAQRWCGEWEAVETGRDTSRAAPCSQFELMPKPTAYQEYVILLSNGPAAEDSDRFAARLLATVIGDDSGSRLFWELIDPGLAEYAAVSSYEYQGTGIYLTYLCCEPGRAEDNLGRVRDVLRSAEEQGISERELTLAKNKIAAHVVLQSERPIRRMFSVGNHWLQRREYRTVRDVVDSYQQVTLDDIRAVIQRYPLSQHSTVAVGPLESLTL